MRSEQIDVTGHLMAIPMVTTLSSRGPVIECKLAAQMGEKLGESVVGGKILIAPKLYD